MLVFTKSGTLWLFDIGELKTIKILSVHCIGGGIGGEGGSARINRVVVADDGNGIISASDDGTVKQTCIANL